MDEWATVGDVQGEFWKDDRTRIRDWISSTFHTTRQATLEATHFQKGDTVDCPQVLPTI